LRLNPDVDEALGCRLNDLEEAFGWRRPDLIDAKEDDEPPKADDGVVVTAAAAEDCCCVVADDAGVLEGLAEAAFFFFFSSSSLTSWRDLLEAAETRLREKETTAAPRATPAPANATPLKIFRQKASLIFPILFYTPGFLLPLELRLFPLYVFSTEIVTREWERVTHAFRFSYMRTYLNYPPFASPVQIILPIVIMNMVNYEGKSLYRPFS